MQKYTVRTDLACESELTHDAEKSGTEYREREENGFKVATLTVKNELGESVTKKQIGEYVTVFCDLICDIDGEKYSLLASLISSEIGKLIKSNLGAEPRCILVAGLGNREITADNIGPKTVDRLTVTRHLAKHNKKLFDSFCKMPLCAVAPGVLGQTGIETAELIGGVCERSKPDIIIAIDALAARSTARLGTTVQISDNGIFPGSGIGNRRGEISKKTLGIPVIAIGVPTVVNSATLVYDALTRAGHEKIDIELENVLKEGESFFVSPRQSDRISDKVSSLLADAINELVLY